LIALFSIVLPIFALVGAGTLARRFAILGPHAARELNQFVVYLALPALLFEIMAKARWSELDQPGFIGFSLSAAAFGAWTLTPATLSAIIMVCVLFAIALALVEAGGSAKASPFLIAGRVAVALARNPLVLSPILGVVEWSTRLLACRCSTAPNGF
jgi:predicted permease